MEFDSNARGTIRASVINMADTSVHMDSNAVIAIESMGTTQYPAGVFFGHHYTPLNDTYAEVSAPDIGAAGAGAGEKDVEQSQRG